MDHSFWLQFLELLDSLWKQIKKFFEVLFKDGQTDPPQPVENTGIEDQIAEISKGVAGDETVVLGQSYLRLIGFPIGNFGPNQNGVDGKLGPATTAAVTVFQKLSKIDSTCTLDEATIAELKRIVYAKLSIRDLARTAGDTGIDLTIISGSAKPEFVNAVYYYAILDEVETAVPAAVTTVQAILETDYGKSVPVDRATGRYSYNLFGIKGTGPDGSVQAYTWEEESKTAKWVQVLVQFKAYHSFADSIKGHSKFLHENSRYAPAFKTRNPQEFARAIASAGYATDSKYAQKLIVLMNNWGLK